MIKYLVLLLIISIAGSPLMAQQYENKATMTIGGGVLEGGNYKSLVTLGEPGGPVEIVEETIYSVSSGFIYVAEKPLQQVLGLKLDLKEIRLYPNPTKSELHLNYSIDKRLEKLMLKIISMDGKNMVSEIIPSNAGNHHIVVDVNQLDQSVYIFSIQSPDDHFKVNMRFIKN